MKFKANIFSITACAVKVVDMMEMILVSKSVFICHRFSFCYVDSYLDISEYIKDKAESMVTSRLAYKKLRMPWCCNIFYDQLPSTANVCGTYSTTLILHFGSQCICLMPCVQS